MNYRERLINTYKHKPIDRVPDFEFGVWNQTLKRWYNEGLPEQYKNNWRVIPDYFGSEEMQVLDVGMNIALFPAFENKVLEQKGDHIVIQDKHGAICEMLRPELGASIPKYLKYAIETRKDWEKVRDERLSADTPGRFSKNIDEICKASLVSEVPVTLSYGSLYGWIRNWMGVENLSYAIYDDPEWVEEMMEHITILILKMLEKVAGKIKIDLCAWWEDMCFRTGPLLSPKLFSQWMVPRYKRVTDFLRNECGCQLNHVDCDGNIHELVHLWLEGGINVMFPLESAHTDAYKISEQFGAGVALRGYYDKRALIEGKEAIDREFERLEPLMKKGGFIPHVDHLVPPDVSFENYCYYRQRKLKFIGKKVG